MEKLFRRATTTKVWEKGDEPETYYWLEVRPDGWIETTRLGKSREEAIAMQNESGYGDEKTKSFYITTTTGCLRMESDSLNILNPAP